METLTYNRDHSPPSQLMNTCRSLEELLGKSRVVSLEFDATFLSATEDTERKELVPYERPIQDARLLIY